MNHIISKLVGVSFTALVFFMTAYSQEYKVAEFGIDVMDLTARIERVDDLNGVGCGVIKDISPDEISNSEGFVKEL